jgi:hypothetical protein
MQNASENVTYWKRPALGMMAMTIKFFGKQIGERQTNGTEDFLGGASTEAMNEHPSVTCLSDAQ